MPHGLAAAARRARHHKVRLFRKIAGFAAARSGPGYETAFKTSLRAHRFFEEGNQSNTVFAELTDSVNEMPAIAHLALRGALADPDEDVHRAAESVLSRHPEVRPRV